MNISSPDIKRAIRRSVAALGIAFTLLASGCTPKTGEAPLVASGNTKTPEPPKALNTATPFPTRTSTPTIQPFFTPSPDYRATVQFFNNALENGALYDTRQLIELNERKCNPYGCMEVLDLAKSTKVESTGLFFDIGLQGISLTIPNGETFRSESGKEYLKDISINANIGKYYIQRLFGNDKTSRSNTYAENRLKSQILENRSIGIGDFNNFFLAVRKNPDGSFAIVEFIEVDNCVVAPAPTNTATATPTPVVLSTPTPTATPPERPRDTPTPTDKKVPPTPASTVGPQATVRPTPR